MVKNLTISIAVILCGSLFGCGTVTIPPETQSSAPSSQNTSSEEPSSLPPDDGKEPQREKIREKVKKTENVLFVIECEEKDGWAIFYKLGKEDTQQIWLLCIDRELNIQQNFETGFWNFQWERTSTYVLEYPYFTYRNGIVRVTNTRTQYFNVATGEILTIPQRPAAYDGDYEIFYDNPLRDDRDSPNYYLVDGEIGHVIQQGKMNIPDGRITDTFNLYANERRIPPFRPQFCDTTLDMKSWTFTVKNNRCTFVYDFRADKGTVSHDYTDADLGKPVAESRDRNYAAYAVHTNAGDRNDLVYLVLQNRTTGAINCCSRYGDGSCVFTESMLIYDASKCFDLLTGEAITGGSPLFKYGDGNGLVITVGCCWDYETRRVLVAYHRAIQGRPNQQEEILLDVFDEYGGKLRTIKTGMKMICYVENRFVTVGLYPDGKGNVTVADINGGDFEDETFPIM